MKNHYYIKYSDISHNTENYPNDIRLRKISDYENVIEYIKTEYNVLQEWSTKNKKWKEPFLITNDDYLSLKYRNVFSENEFKSFCLHSSLSQNKIQELPLENQIIAFKSSLSGKNGEETFNHFLNIKDGKYKEANMFYKNNKSWIDENTGVEYNFDKENGWKTNDWVDADDEFITPL